MQDKITSFILYNGPHVVGAIFIIIAGFLVARWVGKFVGGWLSRRQLEPPVRMLFTRIVKLLVVLLAVFIAVGTVGINIMPILTLTGVLGVGVGLAMQGVLGNMIAGLLIIFTKPFRVGEYVEIINVQGLVDTVELFNTTLVHPDRSRVIVPNRKIVGEVLHNYGTIRQLDLNVGVSYETDISATLALVREILSKNSRVLKEITPGIGVSTLADSSINIGIHPWVTVADFGAAKGEIYQAVIERFRAAGISIPFPQREIRLLNGSEPPELRSKQLA